MSVLKPLPGCGRIAAALAAFFILSAHAEQAVVVTAARSPQALNDALPHTTVISREEIERSQALDLVTLLAAEAGLQASANGGRGTATSLFMRGAPQRQVLVLVDGVPLARQDATGQIGVEHLMLDQVERVEIVRGNVSALYGSGAVGGVIQVFTRRGDGPAWSASAEAGSRDLVRLGAQMSGRAGDTRWSIGVSDQREQGASAIDPAQVPQANPDRDGYHNTSASFDLSHRLAEGHSISLGWLHVDGRLDYDSAFGAPSDLQTSRTRRDLVRLNSEHRLSAAWSMRVALSGQRDDASNDESGQFGYSANYRTGVETLTWINDLRLSERTGLTAGAELQRQHIDADDGFGGAYDKSRSVWAVFADLRSRFGEHDFDLALRGDDVQGLDARLTGRLGWGWQVSPGWKLIASVANAFAAPPLGYLYAPFFGNPDLKPELSRSAELGAQWAVEGQRLRLTLFETRVTDELDFDPRNFTFANLASTRNRGVETSYNGNFGPTELRASLTLQQPVDELTGQQRLRRSEVLASVAASHDLGAGWRVGGSVRYASERPDIGDVMLPAYTVVDLTAQWDFSRAWQLFGRIENAGDAHYQTALGYNQPARGAFIGLRWSAGR